MFSNSLQGEENMLRLSENGELVLVTEQLVCDGQNQRQRIILRVNIVTLTGLLDVMLSTASLHCWN